MPIPADEFDVEKFTKLMQMTTSGDGEALNAIRMANAMLKRLNMNWADLLKGKITIVNDPFGSIPAAPVARPAPPPRPTYQPPPPPPPPPPPTRYTRDTATVERFFDVLEMATLSYGAQVRFDQIRTEWNVKRDSRMTDSDYTWLEQMVKHNVSQSTGGGRRKKPKTLF